MPTYEVQLMTEAKRVARLSRRCSQLRRDLKTATKELRHAKKSLRALAASAARDPFDQSPPIRGIDHVERR
jgi:hypothetical protein